MSFETNLTQGSRNVVLLHDTSI